MNEVNHQEKNILLDLWGKLGSPQKLKDKNKIINFMVDLYQTAGKEINLDFFCEKNYDEIHSINFNETYLEIYWKNFEDYSRKNSQGNLELLDSLVWQCFGYATYIKNISKIKELNFLKLEKSLFILVKTELIEKKKLIRKFDKNKNFEILQKEEKPEEFYTEYIYMDENGEKTICVVNTMPYFSFLIQSKENSISTNDSKRILFLYNLKHIYDRLKRVNEEIQNLDPDYEDGISNLGNNIRRLLEYALKFWAIYKGTSIKNENYSHIYLEGLKSELKEMEFPDGLIRRLDELSHESGKNFSKEDLEEYYHKAEILINGLV